jgi:hypothetical protein
MPPTACGRSVLQRVIQTREYRLVPGSAYLTRCSRVGASGRTAPFGLSLAIPDILS